MHLEVVTQDELRGPELSGLHRHSNVEIKWTSSPEIHAPKDEYLAEVLVAQRLKRWNVS